MGDWNKYLDEDTSGIQPEEQLYVNNTIELSDEVLNDFINRLSGTDEDTGLARAEITYQAYDYDDNNDERTRVYMVSNAEIRISRNRAFQDLFMVDIIFRNAENTELKLFWARLQKHFRNQSEMSDRNWIFYINLLERASVSNQTVTRDELLTGNILNPILAYLTREIPNQRVREVMADNELQGGNIIRMLVPATLLTYSIRTDIDTDEIKGEVQREMEAERYLDSAYGK